MRSIPLELLNRLNARYQADATDARPDLQMICTQTTMNTLISEPVDAGFPGFGDVAIRQRAGEHEPSLAYCVCIEDGIAKIYERRLPAMMEYPWKEIWQLGEAKDVAVEFDGHWVPESKRRWYYFETDTAPLLFWIGMDDKLYVQFWQDESTRLSLAEGVSRISVCSGWQSVLEPWLDQGMVAAYIKGGHVYYRALCTQDTGERFWEGEYEIAQLGTDNTQVSVFRTNDYRLGFLAEASGQMKWVLTHRNYAGMAVRPESVNVQLCDAGISVIPVEVFENESMDECLSEDVLDTYLLLFEPAQEITLSIESTERISGTQIKLELSLPLIVFSEELKFSITVTPERSITDISYDAEETALYITLDEDVLATEDILVVSTENRSVRYLGYSGQGLPWPALSVTLNGKPEGGVTQEALGVFTSTPALAVLGITNKTAFIAETGIIVQTDGLILQQEPVGSLPI